MLVVLTFWLSQIGHKESRVYGYLILSDFEIHSSAFPLGFTNDFIVFDHCVYGNVQVV